MSSFSSMTALLGVSLIRRTSFLPSLRQTDAARVMSVSAMPAAIFATVDSVHGATIMASKRKLPDAMGANISESEWMRSASPSTSSADMPVSNGTTCLAVSDMIRCFSPSSSRRSLIP